MLQKNAKFPTRMVMVIFGVVCVIFAITFYKYIYLTGLKQGRLNWEKELLAKRDTVSSVHDTLWGLILDYRKKKGLGTLSTDSVLCNLAQRRANEVTINWSHNGFINNSDLLYIKYCPGCTQMGENLARGFNSSSEIFNAWINSKPHKNELDTYYTKGCLGISEGSNEYFVSLIMAR